MAFFQFIDPVNLDVMTGLQAEAEVLEVSSTNDTDFQQKLRLSAVDLPEGKYRLLWSYSWNLSSTSHSFEARLQLNDLTTLHKHKEEPTHSTGSYLSTGSEEELTSSGVLTRVLSGTLDIDLDWKAPQKNVPASIWNARLELWRIS